MLRVHRSACLWFVAAVLCIPIAPASAQPPVVMEPLGDLVGGAYSDSYARGVSADGGVVVGVSDTATGYHAFRWTAAGGMVDLGVLPGSRSSYAAAVSADGRVVVGEGHEGMSSAPEHAWRWTAAKGMVDLGVLPGFDSSRGTFVSADGRVVVGTIYTFLDNPPRFSRRSIFRWTAAGGMVDLGVLPGSFFCSASAVSADGQAVVGDCVFGSGMTRAFRWTAVRGMVDLGVLPGDSSSSAHAVSAHGAVVVGSSGGHAFRWTAVRGMVDLGVLPGGSFSYANAVSADGAVVTGGSAGHAFRWTAAEGMVDLGVLPGGSYSSGDGVSAYGAVVAGFGDVEGRNQRAFRWTAAAGMVDLGVLPGESLSNAYLVSADGAVVVGQSGYRAFRAYLGRPRIEGTDDPDQLIGTAAADVIYGAGGDDVMIGLSGNDTYYADSAADVVTETADKGIDTVRSLVTYILPANVERLILIEGSAINGVGNSQSNMLSGNSSSNTLNGRAGNDTLTGRTGRDRFLFNTAPNTSTNYDTITDFKAADDTVLLDNSVFTGLPATGTLAPAAFATGTAATITMHRIIYDPVTGNVWYDRDGVGGAAAVRFAKLTTKPALTNADFHVQ